MSLTFRPATQDDTPRLEELALAGFGPITWARRVDEKFGTLNGKDWKERWKLRLKHIFATQIILVAEKGGETVGFASGTLDTDCKLAYIDLIAVDPKSQGQGLGRELLRAMLKLMSERGAEHAHLDCLVDNDAGNRLYRSEGFEEVARHIRWFRRIR